MAMTHTAWNTSSYEPASGDGRIVSAFAFLALVLLVLSAGHADADEKSAPYILTSSPRTPKDIGTEAKVRRALLKDAQLRPLNLGVHLCGGIAKLSGPVPTNELKQRAITIVQRVDGVRSVRSEDLFISTADQDSKQLSFIIQDDRPTQTRSASPGAPVTEEARRLEGEARRQFSAGSQQITLMAPETTVPSARVPEAARLTGNPHPPSPSVALAEAVARLRQRDPRYQQIRARVQGTTVYIFAGDARSEDAMTFAQAVRRLPGVQHVIVDSGQR